MRHALHRLSIFMVPAVVAACASTDPGPLLERVRAESRQRTGSDPVMAQETAARLLRRPLTADSAAQIALAGNHHLRATLEELGVSQAEFALAVMPQNPSLAASWRFSNPGARSNPEFGLTQEILDLLLLSSRKRLAQSQLDQARLRVTREVMELAFETREAFYTLQGEEQLLGRFKAVAEVQTAAAELAKRLHDAGNISDLEWKEQQTASLEIEFEIKKALAQAQSRREKLNRLMGVSGTSWTLAPALPALPGGEASRTALEQRALAQRLDLAIARKRLSLSEQALALKSKTRLIPGLKLGVDTERDTDGTQLTGPTADIEIPLFKRGGAEVAKLSAGRRQAAEEVAALENDVRSQVREAHAALVAARGAAEHAQGKLLPNQQEILRETLLQYNAMQKSNFELLAAKEREVRAERAAVEALRDYWLARVSLERAVGGRLDGRAAPAGSNGKKHDH